MQFRRIAARRSGVHTQTGIVKAGHCDRHGGGENAGLICCTTKKGFGCAPADGQQQRLETTSDVTSTSPGCWRACVCGGRDPKMQNLMIHQMRLSVVVVALGTFPTEGGGGGRGTCMCVKSGLICVCGGCGT